MTAQTVNFMLMDGMQDEEILKIHHVQPIMEMITDAISQMETPLPSKISIVLTDIFTGSGGLDPVSLEIFVNPLHPDAIEAAVQSIWLLGKIGEGTLEIATNLLTGESLGVYEGQPYPESEQTPPWIQEFQEWYDGFFEIEPYHLNS